MGPMSNIKNITVLGDGGWGTTLGIHLARKNYRVTIWGAFPDYVARMKKTRLNPKFLPGVKIPASIILTSDLKQAVASADLIVLAIPSQYAAAVLKKLKSRRPSGKIFLSVIKGIDTDSLLRMSELIYKALGRVPLAVLSGPTIASEVAHGIPTTAVIASSNQAIARQLQTIFNSKTFRIYTNGDLIGVELGGSIKNVIAVACGVCDGLGYGTNAKAAILTRGLAEMARLGKALGAKPQTLTGLTGLGDLATTCFNPASRNRSVGEALGRGQSVKKVLSRMDMVAEGVATVKAVYKLSQKYKVSMPISTEVYNIIYKGKSPQKAVSDLMQRELKSE